MAADVAQFVIRFYEIVIPNQTFTCSPASPELLREPAEIRVINNAEEPILSFRNS